MCDVFHGFKGWLKSDTEKKTRLHFNNKTHDKFVPSKKYCKILTRHILYGQKQLQNPYEKDFMNERERETIHSHSAVSLFPVPSVERE